MENTEKLVEILRYGDDRELYHNASDAASLIESLAAQLATKTEEAESWRTLRLDADRIREGMMEKEMRLIGENMRLEAQLAKSKRRERAAVEDIMCRDHCDVCKYSKYDGRCDESDFDCGTCRNTCPCAMCRDESNWQWRGPQEPGEGEEE